MLLDTPAADLGRVMPAFTLRDPAGTVHAMADHLTPRGLVVAFVCNHCPYVVAVADRLARDAAALMEEGIGVMAVMSNDYRDYAADSPPRMAQFAAQHGWRFPYLVDEDQSVGRAWGAVCTPDFFGLDGGGRLRYRGRLDDARMSDAPGRTRELVEAMRTVAETGEGPAVQHPSMGCSIKWRDAA